MLAIENLIKTFAGERVRRGAEPTNGATKRVRAVDDVSFEVKEGEMFTLLGPSGCGKTTTLRSIAGLERPDSGEIRVSDRVLFSNGKGHKVHVPPNRRALGMVFQSYAIWPHMKVFDNVAFPLQVKPREERLKKNGIRQKVMEVLEKMELAAYAERQATKLSGGQQQRLALARALVTEPELLLLDEPLSNLDAKLRESLRFELKRFQRELGITSVYVTHDQIEALALSSRIAVMRDGKIMQIGTPREIYEKPANRFVAEFIGTSNFMNGTVVAVDDAVLLVETESGRLQAQVKETSAVGDQITLAVRPEGVEMRAGQSQGGINELHGEVVTRSFLGDSVDHLVRVGSIELMVRANSRVSIPAGTAVVLFIDPENLNVIPLGT
jgi:iron(III) transport system ATP-binding protein